MSSFKPKGRRSIPDELLQFGKHIIYSEGTKTEVNYINNIKEEIADKYKCDVNSIDIAIGTDNESYNTMGLIKYGLNDVKNRIKNNEIINHVWFFFDKDEFPLEQYNNACKIEYELNNSEKENFEGFKYQKDTEITYHCCYSNESFELWLYLYFEYSDAKLSRNDYIDKLKNYHKLKDIGFVYEKNAKNIHTEFIKAGGSIDNAIKYAKKLCVLNNNKCPSTKVWEFMEYFKEYMKK